MVSIDCKTCGKAFQAYPSDGRKYCSYQCVPHPTKHGESHSRLHQIWCNMKARCKGTAGGLARLYYANRGLTVCAEWQNSFAEFKKWAEANGYQPTLELDRRDNEKGYSPENCRWATRSQQMQNTRKRKGGSSKYRGVSWHSQNKKWRVQISVNKQTTTVGCFDDEIEAAKAYDAAARNHFGEFASTNF